MKGYVYILGNAAMPGLVKIGKTTRSVEQRMEELYQSGVPHRFELMCSEFLPDCHSAELRMHEYFDESRYNSGREFFHADNEVLTQMRRHLDSILLEQVEELISEFVPDHVIRLPYLIVDESDVENMAARVGISCMDISGSFEHIEPDAIIAACEKFEEILAARRSVNALV